MSSDAAPVITARGLSKMYELYASPRDRVRQLLFPGRGVHYREHWALRDVSFDIAPGEAFGIIGRNGAGKSTLLQILAGVLEPTEGKVTLPSRVTALLELGSGFKPEFTGRQNIFINAAVLGIPRRVAREKLDDILAFADIGHYVDQPVKTYSSGMFLRLAFAVTTSLDPDVLIIDEALAVGDVFFRQKCYGRLEGLLDQGAVVVLVSHAMNDVAQFCRRALFLDHGRVDFVGHAAEAVKRYMVKSQSGYAPAPLSASPETPILAADPETDRDWPAPETFLDISRLDPADNGWVGLTHVALCDAGGHPCQGFEQGDTAVVHCRYVVKEGFDVPVAGIEILSDKNIIVFGKNTLQYDCPVPTHTPAGTVLRLRYAVKLDLAPGEYTFNLGFAAMSRDDHARRAELTHPELDARTTQAHVLTRAGGFMVTFRLRDTHPIQLTHHGLANLPGQATMTVHGQGIGTTGESQEEEVRRIGKEK